MFGEINRSGSLGVDETCRVMGHWVGEFRVLVLDKWIDFLFQINEQWIQQGLKNWVT